MRRARKTDLTVETILFVAVAVVTAADRSHALTLTQQYDMETAAGPTEPGWTQVLTTTLGSPVTYGFMPAVGARLSIDRGFSTQAPFLVTRDIIYSSTGGTPAADIIFRDIIPPEVISVDLVIYRSDPADGFAPNFSTSLSIDGGAPVLIHPGSVVGGTYHTPIVVFSFPIPISSSTQTLDFLFSDNVDPTPGDSVIRIGGIQLIYTSPVPEPSTLALLGLGIVGLAVRSRRSRA